MNDLDPVTRLENHVFDFGPANDLPVQFYDNRPAVETQLREQSSNGRPRSDRSVLAIHLYLNVGHRLVLDLR